MKRDQWQIPRVPAGGWTGPWAQLRELHDGLPPQSWTLVGGLMVRVHALRARVPDVRMTQDVDAVLHLETQAISFPQAAQALHELGYQPHESINETNPFHRFTRGPEHVDLMVADHLPPRRVPRFLRRDPVKVPGGTSALKYHTVDCVMVGPDGHALRFSLPDTLGALTLKGGAYLTDTRDRDRHLQDGAVLLSTVHDPRRLRGQMQGRDSHRVSALIIGIEEKPYLLQRFDTVTQARITAVSRELRLGREALEADPIKNAHKGHSQGLLPGRLCGARTRAGGSCRNLASCCTHHRHQH